MSESTPAPGGHKKCRGRCGEVKPLSGFYRGKGKGGYTSRCRACTREDNQESYERACARTGRPKAPAPVPVIDGRKRCDGECGGDKPLGEFYRHGNGYRRTCKDCMGEVEKQRRQDPEFREAWLARRGEHYRANRESILAAQTARWANRTPEQVERDRASSRAWYETNRERVYEYSAKWRVANPERHRENARQWAARHRKANLEHVQEVGRRAMSRRRARLRNLPCEPYTLTELLERDGTDCVLCGGPLDLAVAYPEDLAPTREHLECLSWPDATAGDVPSNVGVSHWKCNNERRDRPHPAAARKRAELLAAERLLT